VALRCGDRRRRREKWSSCAATGGPQRQDRESLDLIRTLIMGEVK